MIFKWFQSAEKKCERLGHKIRKRKWRVLISDSMRGVADRGVMIQVQCIRCGEIFGDTEYENREPIHNLSMPSGDFDQLRDDGYLIRSHISDEPI